MRILQSLLLEALSPFLPDLDLESLQVNLRQGRANLSDVELNTSPIFSLVDLPFRLIDGKLGDLNLHVPWSLLYSAPAQVNVKDCYLVFEEVEYGDGHSQEEFFEAERQKKRRSLADGERVKTAASRALQRFLPILLDRVKVDVKDFKAEFKLVGGIRLIAHVGEFSTRENGVGRSTSSELVKQIYVRKVDFKACDANGMSLFEQRLEGFNIRFNVRDGVYDISVNFINFLHISIDIDLITVIKNIKERKVKWDRARVHGRPKVTIEDDPKQWWAYAFRVLKRGRSSLSWEHVKEFMSSCVEYRKLHVARLSKGSMLAKSEEERAMELEDVLGTEMLLLLRKKARADVLAEEVSAFATKDWLRWAFFGGRMSAEQDRLAGELRNALAMAEQGKVEGLELKTKDRKFLGLELTLIGLNCHVGRNISDSIGSILLSSEDIKLYLDDQKMVTSFKTLKVIEKAHGGCVSVSPSSNIMSGIRIERYFENAANAAGVEVSVANIEVSLTLLSVREVLQITMLMNALARMQPVFPISSPAMIGNSPRDGNSFSLILHHFELHAKYKTTSVLLRFKNVFCVSNDSVLSGSVGDLEAVDCTGPSEPRIVILKTSESSLQSQDQRCLNFASTENEIRVNLMSLQITLLRAFIDRLIGLVKEMQSITKECLQADEGRNSIEIPPTTPTPKRKAKDVLLQASSTIIQCPLSPRTQHAVSLNASRLTLSIHEDSLTFSARKVAILARAPFLNRIIEDQMRTSGDVDRELEWNAMVKGLDFDIFHETKFETVGDRELHQSRSEWEVQVLSKVFIAISATQIRMLMGLPQIFESQVNTNAKMASKDGSKNMDQESSSPTSFLNYYAHSSLKIVTQAISVEFVQEGANGALISSIARLTIDPLRISRKSFFEKAGSCKETKITRLLLESHGVYLEDRAQDGLSHLTDIIRRDQSFHAFFPRESHIQKDTVALRMESVTRVSETRESKSSLNINLSNLVLVPSIEFQTRLTTFFSQCSPPFSINYDGNPHSQANRCDEKEGTGQRTFRRNDDARIIASDNHDFETPWSKFSIEFRDSYIQVFGTGRRVGHSSILSHVGLLKCTLLLDHNGSILEKSKLRVQDITTLLVWLPSSVIKAERTGREQIDSAIENRRNSTTTVGSENHSELVLRKTLQDWPHRTSISQNSLRWNFHGQDTQLRRAESIAYVRRLTVRFPSKKSNRIIVFAPALSIDGNIRSLLRFAFVASVANVLPNLDNGPEDDEGPPEIQVSINNVSIRMRIARSHSSTQRAANQDFNFIIRSIATVNVLIARNLSAVSGTLKISSDVVDATSGIRDQIISPCIFDFDAHGSKHLSLSLSATRLLKLVISPLTARTLAALLLNMLPVTTSASSSSRTAQESKVAGVRPETVGLHQLSISISLRGIVLSCVAEQPRMQVLRLLLRQVRSCITLPLKPNANGQVSFSLQDIILEDTISWRLFQDDEDGAESRWASVFAGTDGPTRSNTDDNPALSTSIRDALRSYLGFRKHERLPASISRESSAQIPSESQSTTSLENTDEALCLFVASWRFPLEDVSAHLRLKGFQVNLNMSILPSFVQWLQSIVSSLNSAQQDHARQFRTQEGSGFGQSESPATRIGIDHLVIESFEVKISSRAPSRRIQETSVRRALMWLFGSEEVIGLTIQTPRIVFNGDFDGVDQLMYRLRSVYLSSLSAQNIAQHLFWQAPKFVRIARVAVTSMLRNRAAGYSLIIPQTNTNQIAWHRPALGLREALQTAPRISAVVIHAARGASHANLIEEKAEHANEHEISSNP